MKNKNGRNTNKYYPLLAAGLLLNSSILMINRFITNIPDAVSITLSLAAIILMISSLILMQKENRKKGEK